MVSKQTAEIISQKMIDVLEIEINKMSFEDGLCVTFYVANKILDTCFNLAQEEKTPHNSAIIIFGPSYNFCNHKNKHMLEIEEAFKIACSDSHQYFWNKMGEMHEFEEIKKLPPHEFIKEIDCLDNTYSTTGVKILCQQCDNILLIKKVGIMNVKDAIISSYNKLPSDMMKIVVASLKGR